MHLAQPAAHHGPGTVCWAHTVQPWGLGTRHGGWMRPRRTAHRCTSPRVLRSCGGRWWLRACARWTIAPSPPPPCQHCWPCSRPWGCGFMHLFMLCSPAPPLRWPLPAPALIRGLGSPRCPRRAPSSCPRSCWLCGPGHVHHQPRHPPMAPGSVVPDPAWGQREQQGASVGWGPTATVSPCTLRDSGCPHHGHWHLQDPAWGSAPLWGWMGPSSPKPSRLLWPLGAEGRIRP